MEGGGAGFVQGLHLLRFYNVPNLQTRAISWFVYLVVGWYSLPCKLGCRRRHAATGLDYLHL